MGACTSSDSRSTAKLILQNGQLKEFTAPVKVSHLLNKNPATFICNSDDMDFDDVVFALPPHHFLLPGHLYFLLPLNRLNQPLTAADMAAFAVKANLALGCHSRLTVVESDFNEIKTGREIGNGRHRNVKSNKSHGKNGRRRRITGTAALSAIPE